MSKEAEEYLKENNLEGYGFSEVENTRGKAGRIHYSAEKIMQAYADESVKPVQQELERWKYLYQTEFDKNKLKTK